MKNNLLKKYENMSLPAKASIWFMITNIITRGISFITTPMFTRILTQEEYGVASLYNTWLAIITIFATFELATGVFNKAMIKFEEDRDGYTSASLVLASILTLSFFGLYLLAYPYWNRLIGLSTKLMIMMFAEIFVTTAWSFFAIRRRFEYDYKGIVIITIFTNIVATLVSLFMTIHAQTDRVDAKVFGLLIVRFAIYFCVYIYIMIRGKVYVNKKYWKYSLNYNLPLIPHYLSQQVLNQSDRIMISHMCGNADAGAYSLAYQLAILMQIITNAIHASFMPWSFQCMKENKVKQIGKRAFQIEIFIGAICTLFALFAPEMILVLGGENYVRAIYAIPPVAMSILFLTMYSFFGNVEFYFEKTKFIMIASCVVAICNIIMNYFFIVMFGFVAAGYTTLACYIVYCFIHYLFMKKICRDNQMENPFPGKKMWAVSIAFTGVSIGVAFLYQWLLIRYIVIVIVAIICAVYTFRNIKTILGK